MIPAQPRLEPEHVELDPLPTAVVRRDGVTIDDIRELFDTGFAALGAAGIEPTGPAFAIYRGDPTAVFDAEIGFPVAAAVTEVAEGPVEVEPSTFPSGPALALSHLGPYDSLGESWGRLMGAVAAAGTPGTTFIEVYVTEPSPHADPAAMRTDLFAPLR